MGKLTFSEYQAQTNSTAIYPGKGRLVVGEKLSPEMMIGLSYVMYGLAGESGEIFEKLKKIIRDKQGIFTEEAVREVGKEVGDLLWYLAQFAETVGFNLGDVAQGNLDKLASRKERGVLSGSGDNR